MKWSGLILTFIWLLNSFASIADDITKFTPFSPNANVQECVRDTEFMRKNHMDLLFEQRDLVVIKGIRSKTENFNRCLSCHAVKNKVGLNVSYEDPKHFCRGCHDFTAVKIDCFDCHSSVPDKIILDSSLNER